MALINIDQIKPTQFLDLIFLYSKVFDYLIKIRNFLIMFISLKMKEFKKKVYF
jgi:hypothetical protein